MESKIDFYVCPNQWSLLGWLTRIFRLAFPLLLLQNDTKFKAAEIRSDTGLFIIYFQKGLLDSLKRENEVMDDINLRVLDNRAICRAATTEWRDQEEGTIRELSRQYVKCNENELLQKFYLERKSASEEKVRYNYRCCRLSMKEKWQRPDDM